MASTLTVDNIVGATTAANVHIPGHVIQVVRGVIPTASETISSTSYAASSLYVTITPKSSTSSILLMTSINFDSTGANGSLAFHKDGVIITPGSTPYDGHAYYNRVSNSRILTQQPVMAYDSSVGTTSAVTYGLYARQHSGNFEIRHDLAVDCLVAMEIAQ